MDKRNSKVTDANELFELLDSLVNRYKDTMETSVVAMYQQKLLDLIEIEFRNWGFALDRKLINEVRKWD